MVQSVNAAFTAEERDTVRQIAHSLLISWHKQSTLSNRTFTIGVSLIGGNDVIGLTPGSIGSPANYKYFDESAYAMRLGWERGLNIPQGGVTMAMAEAMLDNTSRRFLPRYMGGNSELYTAILPSRPVSISAGFNIGNDIVVPQFAGVISEQPTINYRDRTVSLKMNDYIMYFRNKKLDTAVMFTGQRTDQVMTTLSTQLGMNTAQYDYDMGINIIPFGYFPAGTSFADVFGQLVEAENGHFFQDENGIFKFYNRQHFLSSPYNQIQRIISTAQVINAQADDSHIVNVVEIKGNVRTKQPDQVVYVLSSPVYIAPNTDTPMFVNFQDPILALDTPSGWIANSQSDGSGTDLSTSISLKAVDSFAQSAKLTFTNPTATGVWITSMTLYGRPALVTSSIYYRSRDGSSVTAYQEQTLSIENDFIQSPAWAQTYAQMILNDWSDPANILNLTIMAMPELQLGDLVSWQGRYWRLMDIKTTLDPTVGFVQDLLMIQQTVSSYFRIGISTIGSSDKISP